MADKIRFIHVADAHLGRQFARSGDVPSALGNRLRSATYDAFTEAVEHALRERVDFVVLAGDTVDSADLNLKARAFLVAQLARLGDAGIQVFMVYGNHDPASAIGARQTPFPPNVHVFSTTEVEEVSRTTADGRSYTVYGRSFETRAVSDPDFAAGYRRRPGTENAVAVLHTNVGGQAGHDNYAPTTVSALSAAGMDYWALGHIHQAGVLASGNPTIVYAGSTQPLQPNETGDHGCYLVELAGGVSSLTWLPTARVGVVHAEVNTTGLDSVFELPAVAARAVEAACAQSVAPSTLVRLIITGSRSFDEPLQGETLAELIDAVRDEVSASGIDAWVTQKVVDRSRRDLSEEMAQSANPFVHSILNADSDATLLRTALDAGKDRLGAGTKVSPGASAAVPDLVSSLESREGDILAAARELAYSYLMGGGA